MKRSRYASLAIFVALSMAAHDFSEARGGGGGGGGGRGGSSGARSSSSYSIGRTSPTAAGQAAIAPTPLSTARATAPAPTGPVSIGKVTPMPESTKIANPTTVTATTPDKTAAGMIPKQLTPTTQVPATSLTSKPSTGYGGTTSGYAQPQPSYGSTAYTNRYGAASQPQQSIQQPEKRGMSTGAALATGAIGGVLAGAAIGAMASDNPQPSATAQPQAMQPQVNPGYAAPAVQPTPGYYQAPPTAAQPVPTVQYVPVPVPVPAAQPQPAATMQPAAFNSVDAAPVRESGGFGWFTFLILLAIIGGLLWLLYKKTPSVKEYFEKLKNKYEAPAIYKRAHTAPSIWSMGDAHDVREAFRSIAQRAGTPDGDALMTKEVATYLTEVCGFGHADAPFLFEQASLKYASSTRAAAVVEYRRDNGSKDIVRERWFFERENESASWSLVGLESLTNDAAA